MQKLNYRFAVAFLIMLTLASSKCGAAASSEDLGSLTDQIVSKELDLLKLNATTKLNSLPHSPWAARRWTAIGAANNTLTAVGALQTGAGRFYWLNSTKRAPNNYFATAAKARVIANGLSVGGATVELAADRLTAWQERKHGTDIGTARKNAATLTSEIDELLNKRAAALSAVDASDPDRRIFEQEGLVLKDMRDLADNEFARFYSEAKGGRLTRNLGYIISWLSNAESGVGSYISSCYIPYRTRWTSRYRTRAAGLGGITDIVSGGLNVTAPFLTRAGGALERMSTRSSVCKQLDCKQSEKLAELQKHENELVVLLREKPALNVSAKLIHQKALNTELDILNQHNELRKTEQKAARARFVENAINSGVSGGTKIANGIGGAVGAFQYTRDPKARFRVSGEVSMAYGAGNAFSAMETLRNQFWNELTSKRVRNQHRSTGQILKAQIAELDKQKKAIEEHTGSKYATNPDQSVQ